MHARLHTRLCDAFGIEVPIVQTGMGWVAGPRLVSATAEAGALGILASATMTYDQLEAAIREVRSRTSRPFGVNLRADAEDADARVALLVREQVPVASFALAPREHQIKQLKDAGIAVVPSIGARRHAAKVAAWGAQRGRLQEDVGHDVARHHEGRPRDAQRGELEMDPTRTRRQHADAAARRPRGGPARRGRAVEWPGCGCDRRPADRGRAHRAD